MRLLALRIETLSRRHPWLTACSLLLLAGTLFLPPLHHLVDHHEDGAAGGDCPLCLLLKLTFLALPALFALDSVCRAAAFFVRAMDFGPTAASSGVPGARAPPLSN